MVPVPAGAGLCRVGSLRPRLAGRPPSGWRHRCPVAGPARVRSRSHPDQGRQTMTDVASDPVPPAADRTGSLYGTPVESAPTEPEKSTVDSVKERAAEFADQAGDALEKAGDVVQDAAEKAYEATKEA